MAVPAKVKLAAKVVGYIIAAVGVIDLPDQIQRWIKFIQSLRGIEVNWEAAALGNAGRWAFTIVGLLILLWAYDVHSILLSRWRKHTTEPPQAAPSGFINECPNLELTPSEGPGRDLRLAVMNRGAEGKIGAKCKIIAVRNDPRPRTGSFALKWLDISERERTIRRHDTENLLIARLHPIQAMEGGDRANFALQMDLLEWSVNGAKEFTSSRWNMPDTSLPEYDVEVMVFCDSAQRPMIANYTIRPKSAAGSLEMIVRSSQESSPAGYTSRTYVKHTFQELVDLFGDKTEFQGQQLVEPYIGKWMKVSGPFEDLSDNGGGLLVSIDLHPHSKNKITSAYLGLCFDKKWIDHLSVLKPGQVIAVACRINTIERLGVVLTDCELLL